MRLLLLCLVLSFSLSAFGQCLSGYYALGTDCLPANTISIFLGRRNTLFRFRFDDLQDSSGKGNTLTSNFPIAIVPVPGEAGENGASGFGKITIPSVPITSSTCFYTKFFWNGKSYDPLTLTNTNNNQPKLSVSVSSSGQVTVKIGQKQKTTQCSTRKNKVNTIGVCLRSNGKAVISVNGEREGIFKLQALVNQNYKVVVGGGNNIILDEVLAYNEPEDVTYDNSLIFDDAPDYDYRSLGVLSVAPKTAAFTYTGHSFGKSAFYITHFGGPFGGTVEAVFDFGAKVDHLSSTNATTVATGVIWPNKAVDVPNEVFGENFLIVSGGFLTPFASTGAIYIVDLNTNTKYTVSTPETGYYYHMTLWHDVDGDGLLDILSAKTQFPVFPFGRKLVWFKNPGTFTFPWQESILINNGPDVFFRLYDFDNDGILEIAASIVFGRKLSIFKNAGVWTNPADWTEIVIETGIGLVFDVKVEDLNKDGNVDLLVTNHVGALNESAVFAYEVPEDIQNGIYTKHVLSIGSFKTTQPGNGQASPGSPIAFHPKVSRTYEKPFIFLAGDGTQRAHLLRPLSRNSNNWDYDLIEVVFGNNTVGGVSVGDVDGDGFSELFVPVYENGLVYGFTYN